MIKFPDYQKDREDRYKFFIKEDFKGASILDLGCNAGDVLKKAKEWGASEVLGIDYDESFERNDIIIDDLDRLDFSQLPEFDVVMILSVVKWVKNPKRLVQEAEKKCKKVMYFEGHQQDYEQDNFKELFTDSRLEWRKLGEVPNRRPFYRGVRKS